MRKGISTVIIIISVAMLTSLFTFTHGIKPVYSREGKSPIQLPAPKLNSKTSIENALLNRRSIRDFAKSPINLAQIAQLLWAAQGITKSNFYRTAPSAGALYPLELYLAVGNVNNLGAGVYKYRPKTHDLMMVGTGDKRRELFVSAWQQEPVLSAPAVLAFAAVIQRTMVKYGSKATRYVAIEVGHAAQNVALQAVSLDLASVTIGAFDEESAKKILNCQAEESVLYLMPIGNTLM